MIFKIIVEKDESGYYVGEVPVCWFIEELSVTLFPFHDIKII